MYAITTSSAYAWPGQRSRTSPPLCMLRKSESLRIFAVLWTCGNAYISCTISHDGINLLQQNEIEISASAPNKAGCLIPALFLNLSNDTELLSGYIRITALGSRKFDNWKVCQKKKTKQNNNKLQSNITNDEGKLEDLVACRDLGFEVPNMKAHFGFQQHFIYLFRMWRGVWWNERLAVYMTTPNIVYVLHLKSIRMVKVGRKQEPILYGVELCTVQVAYRRRICVFVRLWWMVWALEYIFKRDSIVGSANLIAHNSNS